MKANSRFVHTGQVAGKPGGFENNSTPANAEELEMSRSSGFVL